MPQRPVLRPRLCPGCWYRPLGFPGLHWAASGPRGVLSLPPPLLSSRRGSCEVRPMPLSLTQDVVRPWPQARASWAGVEQTAPWEKREEFPAPTRRTLAFLLSSSRAAPTLQVDIDPQPDMHFTHGQREDVSHVCLCVCVCACDFVHVCICAADLSVRVTLHTCWCVLPCVFVCPCACVLPPLGGSCRP